jgi:ketosteroid isomerase-like protein
MATPIGLRKAAPGEYGRLIMLPSEPVSSSGSTRTEGIMSEADNVQRVKDAFAAFMVGDIPSVLAQLDPSIDWQGVIGTEGVLPQSGRRHGMTAVQEFFRLVDETVEFASFEPKEYVAQGDTVVAMGHYTGLVKHNGHTFGSPWVMAFTFRNGRVVRFREFADSAQLVRAFSAAAVEV